MSRRPGNLSRRIGDGGSIPLMGSSNAKSRRSPLFSVGLVFLATFVIFIVYSISGPGSFVRNNMSYKEGLSCTEELVLSITTLKSTYKDRLHKVLHIGPDTCSVVSKFYKESIEAWGIEPYEMEEANNNCKRLVHRGIVRVADIKFSLPYQSRSFPLVLVSDALDYLTPRYLNKTLPDLARVSKNGLVIFSGHPDQQRSKITELSKFGKPARLRNSSWWISYFSESDLELNEEASKAFDQAASQGYAPRCQVFHLKPRSYI